MRNLQFYSTCRELAIKMSNEIVWDRKRGITLLDSSAGTGAILDILKGRWYGYKNVHLFAIEIDPERRDTLRGKGYRVIGSDFLGYSEPVDFDCIVINPPFNMAIHHVLKAWDMISEGGQVIALVNTNTIENDYSKERKLLATLIAANGKSEPLGRAFPGVDVNASMIVLNKPKKLAEFDFEAHNLESDNFTEEEFAANPLAHVNAIDSLVAQYEAAQRVMLARYRTEQEFGFYLNGISTYRYTDELKEEAVQCFGEMPPFADQILLLKGRFWHTLFSRTKLGDQTTSSFRKQFSAFAAGQATMAFSKANVLEVLGMFFENREQILLDCLESVFDRATAYHKKNQIHHEGWVTNKGWRLNKRIIMPKAIDHNPTFCSFSLNSCQQDFITDIDRVLCWLSGVKLETITLTYPTLDRFCVRAGQNSYSSPLESTHFTMKIHKKGTLWMDFKDEKLLAEFNKIAAQHKKWIGGEGY